MPVETLCDRLETAAVRLDSEVVATELRDYFTPTGLVGLDSMIKVGIRKVIAVLRG